MRQREERVDVGAVAVRHDPASAALVRRAIAADLTAHAISRDSIEDVVLVASELVGNAVVHTEVIAADTLLDVSWELTVDWIVLVVGDGSAVQPAPRDAAPDQANGRGLAIVSALAQEWGVEPTPSGKRVWARIPIHAA